MEALRLQDGLISLVPLEDSLGSTGCSTGCSSLDASVGQDPLRELLLGPAEAGTCSSVLRVDLDDSYSDKKKERSSGQI